MQDDPHGDDLARLMAAEEAEIRDDGFSDRVIDSVRRRAGVRQAVVFGSGLAGLGFAVGSLPALVRLLPQLGTTGGAAAKAPGLFDLSAYAGLITNTQMIALMLAGAMALGVATVMLALRER
ncbi:MAG: hypothetical protein GC155_16380 [Alphaproteobacteria bacterium]|nr:hypothetical protein [Alphaproteobacteria bacterium]